jgi:hypothetical protein
MNPSFIFCCIVADRITAGVWVCQIGMRMSGAAGHAAKAHTCVGHRPLTRGAPACHAEQDMAMHTTEPATNETTERERSELSADGGIKTE